MTTAAVSAPSARLSTLIRRGWAMFWERYADAAGAFAVWCALVGQPLLAVERLGGRWWVSLDTSTAGREPTAQEFAIVSCLARRIGAGLVAEMELGLAVSVPDFRTACRLASRLARALRLRGGIPRD